MNTKLVQYNYLVNISFLLILYVLNKFSIVARKFVKRLNAFEMWTLKRMVTDAMKEKDEYGSASASELKQRVLVQLVHKNKEDFNKACHSKKNRRKTDAQKK